ncbi:MAG: hypothetical protein IKE75_00840 [Bacilli bacterium]|nr:hypothetical protein [Bacilli bacterium]
MYRCGFVPSEYVVNAIYESNMKKHDSAKRNYQRMIYENAENNTELEFGVMLDDEIRKISKFDRCACGYS